MAPLTLISSAEVILTIHNCLGAERGPVRVFLERFTRWQLTHWPSTYSLSYAVGVRWGLGRRIALGVRYGTNRSRLGALIEAEEPDVVVSTYTGITAPLGVMRQRGRLRVPVCALVTDLASLHFWAHPGADLHLASYPESLREIAAQDCPVIAYGFARGHVRHNTRAMVRHGLIKQAKDSHELTRELRQTLDRTQAPAPYAHDRAYASTAILDLIRQPSASPAMTPARIGANAREPRRIEPPRGSWRPRSAPAFVKSPPRREGRFTAMPPGRAVRASVPGRGCTAERQGGALQAVPRAPEFSLRCL